MNDTECGENFSYYAKYIEVASKVWRPFATEEKNLDYFSVLWGEDNGKIGKAYERFHNLCPNMSEDCSDQEVQVKIIVLRGIANVMVYTIKAYDNNLDIDIRRKSRDLNNHLYESSLYFSRDLSTNQWNSEKNQIDRAHIN